MAASIKASSSAVATATSSVLPLSDRPASAAAASAAKLAVRAALLFPDSRDGGSLDVRFTRTAVFVGVAVIGLGG
jgi:hypothetical protein